MDRQEYMAWLSEIDELSADQRAEAGRALAGQPSLKLWSACWKNGSARTGAALTARRKGR